MKESKIREDSVKSKIKIYFEYESDGDDNDVD